MDYLFRLYDPLISEKIRNVKIYDLQSGNTYFHAQSPTGVYDLKIDHPSKVTIMLAYSSEVILEFVPKPDIFQLHYIHPA